jgi:DNA-binding NarL/FixJ family response regulator
VLKDEAITVLVVDDHPGVRAAIEALIARTSGLRVVGSVSTGASAIERARRLKPTVVIMDLGMPDINGVEATRAIRLSDGAPAVVAFSGSRELWREARAAGAADTLLKDEDPDRLLEAIRAAAGS